MGKGEETHSSEINILDKNILLIITNKTFVSTKKKKKKEIL